MWILATGFTLHPHQHIKYIVRHLSLSLKQTPLCTLNKNWKKKKNPIHLCDLSRIRFFFYFSIIFFVGNPSVDQCAPVTTQHETVKSVVVSLCAWNEISRCQNSEFTQNFVSLFFFYLRPNEKKKNLRETYARTPTGRLQAHRNLSLSQPVYTIRFSVRINCVVSWNWFVCERRLIIRIKNIKKKK